MGRADRGRVLVEYYALGRPFVTTQTLVRLVLGLGLTPVVGLLALRRVFWLFRLVTSGQPASGRTDELGTRIWTQIAEVFGQRRLSSGRCRAWRTSSPCGASSSCSRCTSRPTGPVPANFHIPDRRPVGRAGLRGGLLRPRGPGRHHHVRHHPVALRAERVRAPVPLLRFAHRRRVAHSVHDLPGHLQLRIFRGAAVNTGNFPYGRGAFFSHAMGSLLHPLGAAANEWIETIALLAAHQRGALFLLIVLHSKHLHIFLAPINVTFKRLPDGLGPLLPVEYSVDGKAKPIDFENPPDDASFGRGKIEDFTWKGMLDFATCTECGRCQSHARPGTPASRSPQAPHHGPARPLVRLGALSAR